MNALASLLVAALTALGVGLLDGNGWPSYVLGAGLALSLWVMLFAGSFATPAHGAVSPIQDGAWWAVGFIMAGVLTPAVAAAADDRSPDAS